MTSSVSSPEVVALGVAASCVPVHDVVAGLQLDVGHGHDPLGRGATHCAHVGDERLAAPRVPHPDVAERHDTAADTRREGRLARRRRTEVTPPAQRGGRLVDGEVDLDRQRLRADVVQPELELGDHPEVAPASAQRPVQVGVLGLAGPQHVPVGGDDLERHHVVAGQAGLPGQPAHPAAEGEAADPGVRHVAGGDGEPVLLARPVQRSEQSPALHDRPPVARVDPDRTQRRQVDHQPVLGHGVARRAVAAAPDADLEVLLACRPDRGDDIAHAGTPDDHLRTPVDDRVPDRAGLVVRRVAGNQHRSVQRAGELCLGGISHATPDPRPARNSSVLRLQDALAPGAGVRSRASGSPPCAGAPRRSARP